MAVMTLSWRILALILVTFIAPWILRDHAGKGITSADAVLSTSMIAESRSVMKNASVVNVKKDLVGEYWGKPTKPQNSHNTTPLTQSSRDLRRYHRSRLVFRSTQHSRRKAELLERKRRRDLRARGYKVHASTASNEPLGKNSKPPSSTEGNPNNSVSTSRYPLRIIRKYVSSRGNRTGTRQLMLCFTLKDAEGNAFVLSASLLQPPTGRRPTWESSAVYALPNTPHFAHLKREVENKSSSYAANPDCKPRHAHASVQSYSTARAADATSRHPGRKLGEPNPEAPSVHHHSPPRHIVLIVCAIVPSAFTGLVCHMLPSRHNGRLPPSWGPEREGYAFSQWARDVLLWCIMSDWDSSRKCAAILSQLTGSAQEYARQIPPQTIITGGTINGIACDSVTFLMHELSSRFGRLSEETRLESIGDLFDFRSRPGERIDSVLERFDACRAKAAEQGRLTVSYEGLSWILLRAINVSDHQLVQLLLPFNGMMPNSQEQLNQLRLSLRRMGHILEGSPGNVSQSMRSTTHQYVSIPTEEEPRPSQSHAWPQAQSSGFLSSQHSWQQDPAAQWSHHPHDAFATFEDASGTDTDTSSDDDESWGPDLSSMTEDEVAARAQELFWAYARAKKQWRAFTQKPTRKVRRFLRKRGFKGKGKGKPKGHPGKGKPGVVSSTSYLADLSDHEMQSLFPAAVSHGRHWRKSTGKGGKGRRGNPRGTDGRQMQCHSCGSLDHLVAKCPRRQPQQDRPNLFVYTNPAPILSTNPSQPQPGAISSATILMVTPGDEPTGESQSSQNDAWQNARMPQLPRRSTEAQSQVAWSNYRPSSSQHGSVAQTPARSHGPVLPPSPVSHMSIPAQDSHQSFMQSLFGRFLEAGRSRHPHNVHASPAVPEAREEDSQFEPLLPETVQPPSRSSHRSPEPSAGNAPRANTRPFRLSASQSQQPQAIHLTAPVPELPPWALLPGMEFLHGVRHTVPQHVSPYPSVVVSSLDQFGLQGIEEFHQAGRLMAVRSEDRPPGLVASQDSDPTHGQETQIWYDAGEALRTRQRTVRNRDREELEERVRAAIDAQQASEAEDAHVMSEVSQVSRTQSLSSNPPSYVGDLSQCSICLEQYMHGAPLVRLICRHTFHEECWNEMVIRHARPECPCCRGGGTVIANYTFVGQNDGASHQATPEPSFPWWPIYHASTQLDGHSSILVDPGAYTNLAGAEWAVKQAQLARSAGRQSYKTRMPQAMSIKGVGNGTQSCTDVSSIPISIPRTIDPSRPEETSTMEFTFQAPTVEGGGSALPALLGLKSLTSKNAILEMSEGCEYLTFPGPGLYKIDWAPGAIHIPLQRAPSGHLCFRADLFTTGQASDQQNADLAELTHGLELVPFAGRACEQSHPSLPQSVTMQYQPKAGQHAQATVAVASTVATHTVRTQDVLSK